MFGLTGLLSTPALSAQNEIGLYVSPAIIDVPLGQEVSKKEIELVNYFNQPLAVDVFVRSLSPKDSVVDNSTYQDAQDLISLAEKQFILEPGQEKQYSITISKQALPEGVGGYASLVFRANGFRDTKASGVAINTEIAVPVLISSLGEPVHNVTLAIKDLPTVQFGKIDQVEVEIENRGTIHERPLVTFELVNGKGEVIESEARIENLLLPGTKRDLTWSPSTNKRGTYQLQVTVAYQTQNNTASSSTVRVLPSVSWLLLLGFYSGMAAFLGWYVYKKKLRKQA